MIQYSTFDYNLVGFTVTGVPKAVSLYLIIGKNPNPYKGFGFFEYQRGYQGNGERNSTFPSLDEQVSTMIFLIDLHTHKSTIKGVLYVSF